MYVPGTFFVTPRKPPCARNVASTMCARCVRSTFSACCWYVRERLAREGLAEHNLKKNASLRFPFKTVCNSVTVCNLRSTASVNVSVNVPGVGRARSTAKRHVPRMRSAAHHDGRWTDARVDPGCARSSTRIGARRVRSASARAARGSASAARVGTVVKRVPRGAPPGDSSSLQTVS